MALSLSDRVRSVKNAMTEGTDADGGYAVPTFTDRVQAAVERSGAFRRISHQIEMQSDIHKVPSISAIAAVQSPSEAAAITATDPTYAQVTLTAVKRSVHLVASGEVLEDANGLRDAVVSQVAGSLAQMEDGYCWSVLEAGVSSTTTAANIGAVTLANLAAVMEDVSAYDDSEPVWVMSYSVWARLNGLLAATGANEPFGILGAPVVICEGARASSTTTSGQFFAVFGHFKSSTVFGRRRLALREDTESLAANDQQRIFMHSRFDFKILDVVGNPLAALSVA